MSDSESKPAKKATKAAKKKALDTATDIAAGPKGEQVLNEEAVLAGVRRTLDEVIVEGRDQGIPVISGAATVSFHIEVDAASTPIDAVEQVLEEIFMNGLRGYTFLVLDEESGMRYAVSNRRMISLDERDDDDEG